MHPPACAVTFNNLHPLKQLARDALWTLILAFKVGLELFFRVWPSGSSNISFSCHALLKAAEKGFTVYEAVAGLQGGLRGHRPTLLLYLCQLHANCTCIFALMQEFLYQFCIAYFYRKQCFTLLGTQAPSVY